MSSNKTHLSVITPQGVFFDKDIFSVLVQTTEGLINFQHGKSPFVGSIPISQIVIKASFNDKSPTIAAISNGVVKVDKESVNIITEEAILKENIDLNKIEKQKREIEQKLKRELPKSEQLKEELSLKLLINQINTKKKGL